MFIRLVRVPACDRQTDGRTDAIAVGIKRSALQAMQPRWKNPGVNFEWSVRITKL